MRLCYVYDENTGKVTNGLNMVSLSMEEKKALGKIQTGETGRVIEARRKILQKLLQIAEADFCESVIAANATGLLPDMPSMHAPIVRITEIADVLSRKKEGGILKDRGVIDLSLACGVKTKPVWEVAFFSSLAAKTTMLGSLSKRRVFSQTIEGPAGLYFVPITSWE